ncbi:glycosyltransferase family 2 protein, partial [Paenibacillus sp. TAF58]
MKVSILSPVHNEEMHLAEMIESVLAQSHADFELLIVDDGSVDRTVEVARSFEGRDSRVRVLG